MAVETTSVATWEPDTRELDIFRKHFAPEKTTDSEWEIYLQTCRTYRLSPMRKQIYLVSRWDNTKNRMSAIPQISIGGLRALALRTGQFEGTTEPEWGDEEGNWYKLWPKAKGVHPYAARIGVYRHGFRAPVWGVAYFHELAQKKKDGSLTKFWVDMGLHMIQKCALADALRGAFEEEVGGLYLHEEMNQADADGVVVSIVPEPRNDENEALQQTASAQKESDQSRKQIPPAKNALKERANRVFSKSLDLHLIVKGETEQENATNFLKLASEATGREIAAMKMVTSQVLDEVEAYINSKDAA